MKSASPILLAGALLAACAGGSSAQDEVLVPAGTFWMGCHPDDAACDAAESPGHAVEMSDFYIDRTEVTRAAYSACVASGACTVPIGAAPACLGPGEHPQTCVSWLQARDFCRSRGKDLPTEAQWEKAARGTDGRIYPWGGATPTCELANSAGCAGALEAAESHPMGASPYGALNMAGNAAEYVADGWDPDYYSAPSAGGPDPLGPTWGVDDLFVLRGGSLGFAVPELRTSWRAGVGPRDSGWASDFGFRCARAVP